MEEQYGFDATFISDGSWLSEMHSLPVSSKRTHTNNELWAQVLPTMFWKD